MQMDRLPTAEEFFAGEFQSVILKAKCNKIIEFTKLHVQAALKEASEKANWNCETKDSYFGDTNRGNYDFFDSDGDGDIYQVHFISVNKDSVLTAYPLENIK